VSHFSSMPRAVSRSLNEPRAAAVAFVLLGACLVLSGCAHNAEAPDTGPIRAAESEDLRAYKAEFDRALGPTVEGRASLARFLEEVANADVLLIGDYHTDRAYHRRVPPLLGRVTERVGPLLLVVEFLRREDSEDLARYLEGELSLDGLARRSRARSPRCWLTSSSLDSRGFAAILAQARERGWLVYPVEDVDQLPLRQRDAMIASRARAILERHRGHFPVVFYGQAHLLGRGRLRERLALDAVTVLPRPPRSLLDDTAIRDGGLQRIREGVFYLGPGADPSLGL